MFFIFVDILKDLLTVNTVYFVHFYLFIWALCKWPLNPAVNTVVIVSCMHLVIGTQQTNS